jgi:protein O-GlcNAc transferase
MGVPVLTLKGNRFLSRLGESIARNAGAANWIANDQSEYIAKAIACASELQNHPDDRLMRRHRVLSSSLFNPKNFAENFGDSLTNIWRDYSLNSN